MGLFTSILRRQGSRPASFCDWGSGGFARALTSAGSEPAQNIKFGIPNAAGAGRAEIARAFAAEAILLHRVRMDAEQFGNLGLAAAAYNAGPRRVQDWLAGAGGMPQETRNYVYAITGSPVEDWAKAGKGGKQPERIPTSSCRELMALLKQAPNPFIAGLEQRVTLAAARQWGVQLAAGFSRDKALAMYGRAVSRLSGVIGNRDPAILTSRMRSRGSATFYQVRFGADTRNEADDLCNRIRKAGGACFVLRNRV